MIKKVLAGTALALTGVLAACSSGPAKSSLGPFTMTPCKVGWLDGIGDGKFFPSERDAQAALTSYDGGNSGDSVFPGSEFSITLTATAVVGAFTVAYYNNAGTEIDTGTAIVVSNPGVLPGTALTPREHVRFLDDATFVDGGPYPNIASCKVIGSDSGNA